MPVFEGVRRGPTNEAPAYHAILIGQDTGGNGTYFFHTKCRPGTVTVTVHDDGLKNPPKGNTWVPYIRVYAGNATIYEGPDHTGQVITGQVKTDLQIGTDGANDHNFNIEYDCSNDE